MTTETEQLLTSTGRQLERGRIQIARNLVTLGIAENDPRLIDYRQSGDHRAYCELVERIERVKGLSRFRIDR